MYNISYTISLVIPFKVLVKLKYTFSKEGFGFSITLKFVPIISELSSHSLLLSKLVVTEISLKSEIIVPFYMDMELGFVTPLLIVL